MEDKVREYIRARETEQPDRDRTAKPLKRARSRAEVTRVRQGWVLIGLAICQITLVWVTRG